MVQSIKRDELRPISLFAPDVRCQHVTAVVDQQKLGHLASANGQRRTAEVLFVIRQDDSPEGRRAANILLVRRNIYPPGIYRLPTGGIDAGETPQQAATREIYEETGYRIAAPGLLGVVQYTLQVAGQPPGMGSDGSRRLPFVSYVFVADCSVAGGAPGTAPIAGVPDEVDDYRWIKLADLGRVAAQLRSLNGDWAHWGRFRAVSYEFIQANLP